MAKALLFIALFVLPALVSAACPAKNSFVVQGCVYCDICLAGFETPKSTKIVGAKVRVQCMHRKTGDVVYTKDGETNSTGTYNIAVNEDHLDQFCDVMLLKSSRPDCAKLSMGKERSRMILTNANGIVFTTRFANAMGFEKDEPEVGCAEVLKMYEETEEGL